MKIKIELCKDLMEDEVIIRCASLDDKIRKLENIISDIDGILPSLSFFKDSTEYYIKIDTILFFETDSNSVSAHTASDIYTESINYMNSKTFFQVIL